MVRLFFCCGWERRDYEVYLWAGNQRLRGGRDKRVESLWLSPNFFEKRKFSFSSFLWGSGE